MGELEKIIFSETQTPDPERQRTCSLSSEAPTSKISDLSTYPGVTIEARKVNRDYCLLTAVTKYMYMNFLSSVYS